MKKLIFILLFTLCLFFNQLTMTVLGQQRVLTEGLYRASSLDLAKDHIYYIQNTSPDKGIFVLIFDGNENLQQTARLKPYAKKYRLVPMDSNYRIVVFGAGEATIS